MLDVVGIGVGDDGGVPHDTSEKLRMCRLALGNDPVVKLPSFFLLNLPRVLFPPPRKVPVFNIDIKSG